jgi:hypothetical protein
MWSHSGVLRLGCGLAGVYFIVGELWPRMFVPDKSYILPVIMLLFGLSLLLDAGKKKKKPGFCMTSDNKNKQLYEYETETEEFSCELSFGSRSQLVALPRLREGEAEVSFGELTVDLRDCREFAPDCRLDLDCSFGNLTVLLPATVRAEASSSTAFGEFTVIGQPNPDAAAVVIVEADANFGEITLRYI